MLVFSLSVPAMVIEVLVALGTFKLLFALIKAEYNKTLKAMLFTRWWGTAKLCPLIKQGHS